MSLINKMLKDLESRQHAPAGRGTSQPVYEDLHPAVAERTRHRVVPFVLILFAAAVLAAGLIAGYRWRASASGVTTAVLPVRPAHAVPIEVQPAMRARRIRPNAMSDVVSTAGKQHRVGKPRAAVHPRIRSTLSESKFRREGSRPEQIAAVSRFTAIQPSVSGSSASGDAGTDAHRIEVKAIPLTAGQIAENAYRRSVALLEQGRRTEAERALKTALTSDPRSVRARELLAGLLLEDGHQSEAGTLLDQGLTVMPHQSAFTYLLARIDVARGAESEAIAVLEKGLPDAGSNPNYLALLATLDQRTGRNADAVSMFSRALALRPVEGNWWIGLGISLEALKHWAAAREAYTHAKLTQLDPTLAKYADERLNAIRFR